MWVQMGIDNGAANEQTYSVYLQDEWKPVEQFVLNYGLRFDQLESYRQENQLSPRVNFVWTPFGGTTIHGGYARYFTPPPFELVAGETIQKYQNRSLDTAEIIAELVNLAENMREAQSRGEKLKMSEEEIAFYDALEVNDSAVKVLGDETLRQIALELVDAVRKNASIDWTVKESVRAKMRAIVKRILRAHGYPPDKQEKATQTVLEQAEALSAAWAA